MGGPDPNRRQRTSFKNRTSTLIKKALNVAGTLRADVYLVIRHPRATVAYNSTKGGNWPPADNELESFLSRLGAVVFFQYEQCKGMSYLG
ncbi:hypothetical protein BDV26DRAFT_134973 [Aspergillus bertholletiae]|uniref:MADS-box domain-containing protein n=1 Tax=Aspergillus bertholletiae TaxID=1226010 RepID=A0A5N7AN81_9EURO|nr:hypothetical protein BDV26DRAFT_134973 [Aspergillus bertholletiae]